MSEKANAILERLPHNLKQLPWVIIDGQTGECLHNPSGQDTGWSSSFYATSQLKSFSIPGSAGHNYPLYVVGDLGENLWIQGRHATVFVEGKIGDNSIIQLNDGLVAASSIGKNAWVWNGYNSAILLDDIAASTGSVNMGIEKDANEAGVLVQTKKGKRMEAFEKGLLGYTPVTCEGRSIDTTVGLRVLHQKGLIEKIFCKPNHQMADQLKKAGFDSLGAEASR
jgi:hypothetical protein